MTLEKLYTLLLSDRTKNKIERVTLYVALIGFFVHLATIYLYKFGFLGEASSTSLFSNPISALYTPFSFILVYEVYLLIYYLPKSFTTYITKQYEIITLIIIRKLFKDLAVIELSSDWFAIKDDLQFTYDILASLLLFYLIYQFQKQGRKLRGKTTVEDSENIAQFINRKKRIAVVLIPLLFFMALFTFFSWASDLLLNEVTSLKTINNLFFEEFFTVLILVDVILLLLSFFYTDSFHKIIRNSGFVVSTILIRLSFGISGFISTVLVVFAVVFGLVILIIHNLYEQENKQS